jgi:hypothetical protein
MTWSVAADRSIVIDPDIPFNLDMIWVAVPGFCGVFRMLA